MFNFLKRLKMLLQDPIFYYKKILEKYQNSYLCEDTEQIIIGIDCDYFDANKIKFSDFKTKFELAKQNPKTNAPFGGFFGIMGYEIVHIFEKIGNEKEKFYEFPNFFFANAKNYLHYDKFSKIYTFYGENLQIYNELENLQISTNSQICKFHYTIKTDLNSEKSHYFEIIEKAKEKIKSGDIFQVVLGEILELSSNLDSLEFYEHLKINNPSPYMFHFPTPYGTVTGSSPELIMQIKNDEIFVAPIAGTRRRGATFDEDKALEQELLSDEKELAEHKMLIDLARNDIGKFAQKGSVVVKNAMHIVKYESVMHIVSEVYGKKEKNASIFDIFSIIFPAGTLSGSPKIRAMQIINELESKSRGVYGGGIGFLRFNGDVLLAILIRSAIFVPKDDEFSVFIGAGAGIVYDSVCENEYAEICKKRKSVLKVFEEICEKEIK